MAKGILPSDYLHLRFARGALTGICAQRDIAKERTAEQAWAIASSMMDAMPKEIKKRLQDEDDAYRDKGVYHAPFD